MPKKGKSSSQPLRTLILLLVAIGTLGLVDEVLLAFGLIDHPEDLLGDWYQWSAIGTIIFVSTLVGYAVYRRACDSTVLRGCNRAIRKRVGWHPECVRLAC